MSDYHNAILDAMKIPRFAFKDPNLPPFTEQPILADLQQAFPAHQFIQGTSVAYTSTVITLPVPVTKEHKKALWQAYSQASHA